ncbi:2-amino-4-hydroxy-6-hydroxymethyldihydropteridine pyrophosphokinase [Corynebacterium ciconiae DSM 44920]|uniref:2-amino-4-hydroxy-6- hydroxymethyldihydropteridine diphosphokinase n=1 Tax=Corynebacterium ciconiae TaxID=227319 RepID=UPI00038126BD|nr:2-amino-4-hydroxy-6-hydroxymethyldihydropteridine diphosphokinase [Corynebacterium ciconiae]WKD61963.1 2-amino-4-hydroxy-6-hydroxymethyldihydropteridine pyrophosphokinase [Corynebacterium ciconiae DSM 44920]
MRAVISIGSNTGASRSHLASVLEEFRSEMVACSSLYVTAPWGVEDQPDFLNAVLIVDTESTPQQLLARGQALEARAERVRQRHWGPRTLDVDIVDIPGFTSTDPTLTVPHPYAHQRGFVLIPWHEIAPDAALGGTPLSTLIDALPAAERTGIEVIE